MSFELQSDRDILIETATTVKEMQRNMDRRERELEKFTKDIEDRVRLLEQLRWMVWGAAIVATCSGFEVLRTVVSGGK